MMAKNREVRVPDAEALVSKIEKLQRKHKKRTQATNFDATGASLVFDPALRKRRANQILIGLLLLGLVLFSSMKYVEINLKSPSASAERGSTNTVLSNTTIQLPATNETNEIVESVENSDPLPDKPNQNDPGLEEVTNALVWLGNQSLEEFKLTYPPRDNAYYYFDRLLELDPGNTTAVKGILEIADRYAILAEQSLANNDMDKTATYIDLGLRINPRNEALLLIKNLIENQKSGLIDTIKSLFNS